MRPPAARPRSGNSPFRLHQKADGITVRAAGKAVIFVAIDVERPAGTIPSDRSPATWRAGTYPDGSQPMPVHSLSLWRWQRGLVRQRSLRSAPSTANAARSMVFIRILRKLVGWRCGGICQAGLTFWASNITRSSPRCIPLRIRRQIPQHHPGHQGMVAASIGVQCAGHGGIDDLVARVGQGAHAQPIEDGMFDVVGAAAGSNRISTKPARSRCWISRSAVIRAAGASCRSAPPTPAPSLQSPARTPRSAPAS